MKKRAFFALLLLILLVSITRAQEFQFPSIPEVPVIAHRGFSAIAPENTLTSIKKAIEIGAQGIEFDVYSTRDGILFLTHDGNLKRTTGFDCTTKDIDSATLFSLDFGAWKGEEFRGEKVATYDAALQLFKNCEAHPIVEIKGDGFEEKIVEGLRKYELIDKAIVIDFNALRVQKIRELEPNLCCAWLCSFDIAKETPQSMTQKIIDTLNKCNTNVVDVQFQAISPEMLQILTTSGIRVLSWTVDDAVVMERLVEWGVPSITTNRPDLALQVQQKYAQKQNEKKF